MPKNSPAVTLLELMIAISLLSVMVLSLSSIDIFSRTQLISSDRRVKLQNEASVVLEHMAKQIIRAIGNINNVPVASYADNKGIRVRIDNNPANGVVDATDSWVAYRHEDNADPEIGSEIRYYPNAATGALPAGGYEVIARRVVITNLADPIANWGLVFNFPSCNTAEVDIRCRWHPLQGSSLDNPEIRMKTTIRMHSVSCN